MPKKLTKEEYISRMITVCGYEYEFLGEYVNYRNKITLKHVTCGKEFEVYPQSFLEGEKCPCLKTSTESFKNKIYELTKNEYELLGEYTRCDVKVEFRHNRCNRVFKMSYNAFISTGNRCPYCRKNSKKDTSYFSKFVLESRNGEYSLVGEYKNPDEKINIKHNICGYEFLVSPQYFMDGAKCPQCAGCLKITTEVFQNRVYTLVGDEYSVLGEYIKNNVKIKMIHNKCGNKFDMQPANFLNGQRCPKCSGNYKRTPEEFKNEVHTLVKDEYTLLSDFVKCHSKVEIRHNVCGSTYKVSPSKFLYGQRCPICRESKGEQRVHCLLKDKNIFFHRQYEFADCINKLPLPFDFAIFDRDGKLILLIEYDGEYHYQPIISNKQLKYQQKNDQIKTNYCLAKNIPLLRIPYWEFDNIEQILTEKLAEFESPEKVAFFI